MRETFVIKIYIADCNNIFSSRLPQSLSRVRSTGIYATQSATYNMQGDGGEEGEGEEGEEEKGD